MDAVPSLGQHTESILAELGFNTALKQIFEQHQHSPAQ